MASPRFRHAPSLPELPKGAEQSLVAQFKAIQNDLDAIRGPEASTTAVVAKDALVRVGELLLVAPPAAGLRIGIPPGNSENISKSLRIAVVGGILSPGATVSVVGGQGTINGAPTLSLTSLGMWELTSIGAGGWVLTPASTGGSGLPPDGDYGDITVSAAGTVWTVDAGAVAVGDLANIADETFVGNVSGGAAPPSANLLSSLAGTGLTWNAALNRLDVSGASVGWDDVLAVDNNSGAFNPHIDDGQFLSFGIEGSIPASGDIRSSDAFTINVTGAAAMTGSTSISATAAGNGLVATAAVAALGAGTASIQALASTSLRFLTSGVERLEIETTGAWQLAGAVGASGHVFTSQGAGTTPLWVAPGGGGALTLLTTEVNLGSVPTRSGSFTITGAGMTVGRPVLIQQAVGPYTGKGTLADEAEDQVTVSASVTSATVITAYWSATHSPIVGNVRFNYAVSA